MTSDNGLNNRDDSASGSNICGYCSGAEVSMRKKSLKLFPL